MNDEELHSRTIIGGQTGYGVPLVVAITGHRDLVAAEIPLIRKRVREFLEGLRRDYPDRGVSIVSALAEGADQLVAEEALALNIPLVAVLPMPRDYYIEDFASTDARDRFKLLCSNAAEILEMPILSGNTAASISNDSDSRARQYAQLGVFLCSHCHILLALWDGKYSNKLGGTGEVVRFHHEDVMPGYTPATDVSRLSLADDESDLVYHIVCSRDQDDGEPAEGLTPQMAVWFTTDPDNPRAAEIPPRHRRVFEHTNQFSVDAKKYEQDIRQSAWPLLIEDDAAKMPAGVRDIDQVFRVADWLAIHYQQRVAFTLRATHALALLMGLMYIAYSDMVPEKIFIVAFVLFFLAATGVHKFSARYAWHRKFLDYRALAEGLRVQFHWAVAGVSIGNGMKYAHDNFLQAQDPDLGWIRNVMRVAGMECNATPHRTKEGLDLTIKDWIGDETSGQLGYYKHKGGEKARRARTADRFASFVLWLSFIAVALFVFSSADIADRVRDPIVVLMGVLLLAVGIRHSYGFAVADQELIKQYEFMFRTFARARKRIDKSESDDERRQVLKVLGQASLEEHAEWILMHRERSVDEGEIWRMTG